MEQAYRRMPDGDIVYDKIVLPTLDHTVVVIDDAALEALSEYSSTIPTGTFINKMWRRDGRPSAPGNSWKLWLRDATAPPLWLVCEYAPHPRSDRLVRIITRTAASPAMLGAIAEGILWWL